MSKNKGRPSMDFVQAVARGQIQMSPDAEMRFAERAEEKLKRRKRREEGKRVKAARRKSRPR